MPLKEPSKNTYQGETIQERVSQATGFKFPVYHEGEDKGEISSRVVPVLAEGLSLSEAITNHYKDEVAKILDDSHEETRLQAENPGAQPKGLYLNRYYTILEIGKLLAANKEPILQAVEQNLQENNAFGAVIEMPYKDLSDEKFIQTLVDKIQKDMLNETKEKFEYYGDFDHQKKLADAELSERLEQYFTHTVEKSLSPRSRTKLEKNKALDTLKEYIVEKKISHTVLPIVLNICDQVDDKSRKHVITLLEDAEHFNAMSDLEEFLVRIQIELSNGVSNKATLLDLFNNLLEVKMLNKWKFIRFFNNINTREFISFYGGVRRLDFVNFLNGVVLQDCITWFNTVSKNVVLEEFKEFFNLVSVKDCTLFFGGVDKLEFVEILKGVESMLFAEIFEGMDLQDFKEKIESIDYNRERFIAFLNKHKRLPKYFLGRYY